MLQRVLVYNLKSIAFCCGAIGIPGFDPKKAAKMAQATVRLWLESNHSSIDHVIFCTFENADYEIYKDLMSTVYFPLSKYHLTNIYTNENPNTACVVNVKNVEISNELGQSLPGLQIYPNFTQNSESESLAGRSKRISSKVDFNVIRDPNIPLGLKNYGENVCFFNSVIQVLYSVPVFRDYVKKLRSPVKGVAMKIKKLFSEIETSGEPVRTSNYVRYLGPQHEPGMQYDAHECLLQLLVKIYPNINDDCIFKINKLESTLCNDCGHTTNNDGVYTDWSLHLAVSSNFHTISGMLHQLVDPSLLPT